MTTSLPIFARCSLSSDIRSTPTEDLLTFQEMSRTLIGGSGVCFNLPRREVEILLTGYSIPLRAKCLDRLHELEARAKQTLPALPGDYIQALEHLLESKRSEQKAIEERDHAIATKAEIGSRREATAMASASAAVREARRLADELGRGTRQATVKAVENLTRLNSTRRPGANCVHGAIPTESSPTMSKTLSMAVSGRGLRMPGRRCTTSTWTDCSVITNTGSPKGVQVRHAPDAPINP